EGTVVSNIFIWHGERQQSAETNNVRWSGTNQWFTLTNTDGLLQIASSRRVYVRAFHTEPDDTSEITPEPVHLLTFTCSRTNPIVYDIEHVAGEPTLFRVELRRFLP